MKDIKNLKVDEFATPNPITGSLEENINELSKKMSKVGVRHLPIVSGEEVVGIISDRDIKVALKVDNSEALLAKDIMTENPVKFPSESTIDEVAYKMSEMKISSAIITYPEFGTFGIFTSTDALNALVEIVRGDE